MMIDNKTIKYINRNFRIRIYGKSPNNGYIDRLVGISGFTALLSDYWAIKCIKAALKSQKSKIRIKIYNSYTITFYQK